MSIQLSDPTRHEALTTDPWDEAAIRREIEAIVGEAEATFSGREFWLKHPLERDRSPETFLKSVFFGAAGTLWAMRDLARRGFVTLGRD
jgi:hypothetical protein